MSHTDTRGGRVWVSGVAYRYTWGRVWVSGVTYNRYHYIASPLSLMTSHDQANCTNDAINTRHHPVTASVFSLHLTLHQYNIYTATQSHPTEVKKHPSINSMLLGLLKHRIRVWCRSSRIFSEAQYHVLTQHAALLVLARIPLISSVVHTSCRCAVMTICYWFRGVEASLNRGGGGWSVKNTTFSAKRWGWF